MPDRDEREWWEIPGSSPGLSDALRRLHLGRSGPATDDDRPPPSLFPATAASRTAMRITRENKKKYAS